ncbi:NAD(P)/FAD-dependent oxidoreductase [Aequorivita sp. H23M31]|uniref:NADH:ubiquinone reductase (non-electrogenic) n=1 Tax=Aequorivita ciconiae TaxID=2494375 RepID=A0A410G7C5_9FLAO|nr:NAD(P)/FAD-dependent oxidoreductase [Aequorivita sp. H23M31]QAA83085.1 NAD(P)/FAD-dependent oxidoreductase [Aequorivita sp. H23M31]
MSKKAKIIIIGAGFGGIKLTKSFYKKPVDVLLIDRNNYHNFQPLMYQVATGGLEPGSIAYPVRRIFRKYDNVNFRMAEVQSVDIHQNQIISSIGRIHYDYLVIASGSENKYFNFESVKDKLLTLKSLPEALKMRNTIFRNLERALANNRTEPIEEIMNIAIVGGGPAGIELAGALSEMRKHVLPKEFPELPLSKMSVNLYQSGPKLLAGMSEEASQKCLEYLQEMGVNVFLNTRVKEYDEHTITMDDGSKFTTDTVIWSAGVKGSPLKGFPDYCIDKGNRILVDEFNKVKGTDNIFAIGDVSAHESLDNPKGLPMLAPVAQQQGEHLGKNILRTIDNKPMEPFEYHNKGVMATIGRNRAVVDLPSIKFQGRFAWFVWMFVHIFSLVGFRDKFVTFIDWVESYFNYDQPLGMILKTAECEQDDEQKLNKKETVEEEK